MVPNTVVQAKYQVSKDCKTWMERKKTVLKRKDVPSELEQ